MSFANITEIKLANQQLGYHFFDKGALNFFNSIVYPKVYYGCFFITSEQFAPDTPRLYSIRKAKEDGSVITIGEFQGYQSKDMAREALKSFDKF